jgi:hypothetical protein
MQITLKKKYRYGSLTPGMLSANYHYASRIDTAVKLDSHFDAIRSSLQKSMVSLRGALLGPGVIWSTSASSNYLAILFFETFV